MPIVWKVEANEIGWQGSGALYCETKAEADKAAREHGGRPLAVPVKVTVRNRFDLAEELNAATGYGCT